MRREPFKTEFRRIRDRIHHGFRRPTSTETTHESWRRFATDGGRGPRLTISDVMEERPIAVRPETPLGRALALMIGSRISGLPVVDAQGLIVGALNEQELMKIFSEPEATKVVSVMTTDPAMISIDASLVDATDQMMSSGFRRLLVHDHGRLVGVLTRRHLLPAILEVLKERVGG